MPLDKVINLSRAATAIKCMKWTHGCANGQVISHAPQLPLNAMSCSRLCGGRAEPQGTEGVRKSGIENIPSMRSLIAVAANRGRHSPKHGKTRTYSNKR
jgi:hypothetical protein